MKKKQRKQLTVYISRPLDYPASLYEEIKDYLENKNFIVTTFDGGKYTTKKLFKSDVVFFLTSDLDPTSSPDCGYGHTNVYEEIARGQHTELKFAKRYDKLCVTFSCVSDEVLYILETVDSEKIEGEDSWKRGYAKLHSKHYGKEGAEFSDFVTGYMSSEKQIDHEFHQKDFVTSNLFLLLLDN
tara:strand:+ start:9352 stop:9903 length:552 start_codon:yes stop_codon:yes gene_type:complete